MNEDSQYCLGKACKLRLKCLRYTEISKLRKSRYKLFAMIDTAFDRELEECKLFLRDKDNGFKKDL